MFAEYTVCPTCIGFGLHTNFSEVRKNENFNDNLNMNTLEFIYQLMFIPISQATQYKINKASDKCTILKLKYNKIKFFNFNVTSKDKLEMFSSGYSQSKKFFNHF